MVVIGSVIYGLSTHEFKLKKASLNPSNTATLIRKKKRLDMYNHTQHRLNLIKIHSAQFLIPQLTEPAVKDSSTQLIGARWLLTMAASPSASAETASLIENGGVVVRNGVITEVGDFDSLNNQLREQSHSDNQNHTDHLGFESNFLEEHILLPGLINNHGHLAMSLLRGYADDTPLQTWLQDHIWPAESKFVSSEFVRDGSLLAMTEMLLSGTTTFADMYFFPEECAEAAEVAGMRANIFFPVLEFPSAWGSGADDYLEKGLALHDRYKNMSLINIGFGPHAPYTVSNGTFEKVAMYSAELEAAIQTHLHETANEIQESIAEHGCRPIMRLKELGVLGSRTQTVHMTQIENEEIDILANVGGSVIHCPSSNLKLASGFPPLQKMLNAGLAVGLGTDGAASNNTLDLLEEARLSSLVSKFINKDASCYSCYQALYCLTKGGAEAAGLGEQLGSLEVGKQADIIAINTQTAALQPVHNPYSQIVNTAAGAAVNHVWINGNAIVRNRLLVNVEQADIIERAQHWQSQLAK